MTSVAHLPVAIEYKPVTFTFKYVVMEQQRPHLDNSAIVSPVAAFLDLEHAQEYCDLKNDPDLRIEEVRVLTVPE